MKQFTLNLLTLLSLAVSHCDYPLTWEARDSQANYPGARPVSEEYVKQRISAPHTGHAEEVFLYLLEMNK